MLRLFSGESFKGTIGYLDSQKKYELIRTLIYFGLSIAIFVIGFVTTKTKANLLTVVAILGCLPASKSLISMIMFFKFKSLEGKVSGELERISKGLVTLFDMVFTTYEKNFQVDHIAIKGNTICGLSTHEKTDCKACEEHLLHTLKQEGLTGFDVKIMTDVSKYKSRLEKLSENTVEENEEVIGAAVALLKSISL